MGEGFNVLYMPVWGCSSFEEWKKDATRWNSKSRQKLCSFQHQHTASVCGDSSKTHTHLHLLWITEKLDLLTRWDPLSFTSCHFKCLQVCGIGIEIWIIFTRYYIFFCLQSSSLILKMEIHIFTGKNDIKTLNPFACAFVKHGTTGRSWSA